MNNFINKDKQSQIDNIQFYIAVLFEMVNNESDLFELHENLTGIMETMKDERLLYIMQEDV